MNVNGLTELKFNIKRIKGDYKRVHIINHDNNTECLIDTGSSCAIWCLGEVALKKKYPNAVRLNDTYFLIGGFGGEQIVKRQFH
ncbi:MAG: hypothetical protein K6G26_02380 [Lachnospiraceae bacterium]|nr:hypothetical protein [Lachnospiraceae bacterium]